MSNEPRSLLQLLEIDLALHKQLIITNFLILCSTAHAVIYYIIMIIITKIYYTMAYYTVYSRVFGRGR